MEIIETHLTKLDNYNAVLAGSALIIFFYQFTTIKFVISQRGRVFNKEFMK